MSYFTVMLKITTERLARHGNVEDAVKEMLRPYNEEPEAEFRAFCDTEDKWRQQYETESVEMVRCENGELVYSWDGRFRDPKTFERKAPAHLERVQVAHKDRYVTFEAFVADWHSSKSRDATHNRFGYWYNPNAKWDWYTIGGRWSGFFPVKADVSPRVLV